MRNKNFRSWGMFINIRTRKDYQKIESVIYEIAKAKLLVCFKYVVLNNIVVITNKQNNVERNTNSTGLAMQLKEFVSPLKQIKVLR